MARILVVDDEKDISTLVKVILESDGHEVQTASNGAEALMAIGVEPEADKPLPELIFVDVLMPVMDGYAMSSRLLASPKARSIPLIVLTAKGGMRDLFKMATNVKFHLEKPFEPRTLREAVAHVLSSSKKNA